MAVGDTLVLEITQGEDWTVDLIWQNQFGEGIGIQHPSRMDIKGKDGSTLVTLETNPSLPPGTLPSMTYSNDIGLIQLHITSSVSAEFTPGRYYFDLFVTTDTNTDYGGSQQVLVATGQVNVLRRYTVLS